MGASNSEFFRAKPEVSLLGVTRSVNPTEDQTARQNYADEIWSMDEPKAGQTISLQGARDLIGEGLHHRSMDEIPGIQGIRKSFDPSKQVIGSADLPEGRMGHLEVPMNGRKIMMLGDRPEFPLRTHVVTHELAHLLTHPLLNEIQWKNVPNANGIGHSWPMARAHIHAVRAALGHQAADALRSVYESDGVDFGKKTI